MFDPLSAAACASLLSGLYWDGTLPEIVYSEKMLGPVYVFEVNGQTKRGITGASYNFDTNTIIMYRIANESYLVHEMVHYLQDLNGWSYNDPRLEHLAYEVQDKYWSEGCGEVSIANRVQ